MTEVNRVRDRSRSPRWRVALRAGVLGAVALLLLGILSACDDDGSATADEPEAAKTVTSATVEPFDPDVPAGPVPEQLAKRFGLPGAFDDSQSLAFAKQVETAAKSRGVDYVGAVANGDLTKIAEQTQQMLTRGIGAMFMYPYEEEATRPFVQQALEQGVLVTSVLRPYSHVVWINDPASDGAAIGRAAVKWIEEHAGGNAKVVVFNQDKQNPVSVPQHKATLAELQKGGPGVEVVADVNQKATAEENANLVNTLLQKYPDVNVVLGDGASGVGAFTAFDAKGRGNADDVYISVYAAGDDALEQLVSGRSAIKAAFLYSGPLVGYGLGLYAADWLAGKSIPRLLIPPEGAAIELSSPADVAEYRADMANAQQTWETKRDKYLELWGNISYETRDTYWREIPTKPED